MSATEPFILQPGEQARAAFCTIFEERDLSDPYRFWSDSSVNHFVALDQSVRGAHALSEFFERLLSAVPDWRMEIEGAFDDGKHQAVVQWHATGTFSGTPFLDIESTGKRIELRGVDVFRFDADGKVAENTVYYDGAEFARQVGMLPPRNSVADRGMLAAFNGATRLRRWLRAR